MSAGKIVQEEGVASAKALGQWCVGEVGTAQSRRDWCGRSEDLSGRRQGQRGRQRVVCPKACGSC